LSRVLLAAALIAGCGEDGPASDTPSSPADESRAPRPAAEQAPAPHAPEPNSKDTPSGLDVDAERLRETIRLVLEEAGIPAELHIQGDKILASTSLPAFYEQRAYGAAWLARPDARSAARALVATIERATEHGLQPADYHLAAIRAGLHRVESNAIDAEDLPGLRELAELDLILSDAFFLLGTHLLQGRLHPASLEPTWNAKPRRSDMIRALEEAGDASKPGKVLEALAPRQPEYARLLVELRRLREQAAAGGWDAIPAGTPLGEGDHDPRVRALRQRLLAAGDLSRDQGDPEVLSRNVAEAVRTFQTRHGLRVTGAVDGATLQALNVPAEERVQQVLVNLERWRWLPDELGERHVLVNIAGFTATYRGPERQLRMRAIVGKTYRRTPVFSDEITHLVLNPSWSVPRSIATDSLLAEARRNPDTLAARGFRVFRTDGASMEPVDIQDVQWRKLSANRFPYRLHQAPGPHNALGRVKFMFPNRFNVYLHDTPRRELFDEDERAFSSGCIRLEKPLELAEALLPSDPWSREAIDAAIARGREQTVHLPQRVPVHLLYWTTWVADDDLVHYRPDIYTRDGRVLEALAKGPPS
jgi:L,D-transpeptidase YcbB